MKTQYFAAACVSVLFRNVSASFPSLKVIEDGVEKTLYVQHPNWSSVNTDDDAFSYGYNNRMYLSESANLDTASYYKPNLLGGIMSYDVDLSMVSCGCVSALYTVLMPAMSNGHDPFKYCDANQVGGYFCPEFDI